jgi:hypothetical protein
VETISVARNAYPDFINIGIGERRRNDLMHRFSFAILASFPHRRNTGGLF